MSDNESILQSILKNIVAFKEDETHTLIRKGIAQGLNPIEILENGLALGMKEIGNKFGNGEIFLPELMRGALIMKSSVDILTPVLKMSKVDKRKKKSTKVILGTVKGDIHDIGKNIVRIIFETAGFEIIDLGVDVQADKFVKAITEHQPIALGLSALLTTTLPEMKVVIDALKDKGLRDCVKVIVGGSSLTQEYAHDIGADAYGIDAVDGLNKIKRMISI